MPNACLAQLDTFWREVGTGPSAGVLLHCSLASSKSLDPLMARFADSHRMWALDLPGHGRTGAPGPGVDLQQQAAQSAIALIEQLREPVHLAGHSFGATVAARIAVERPDLVRSLMMFEPVFFAILYDLGWPEYDAEIADSSALHDGLARGDMMAAAAHFLRRWGMPGEWDRMPEAGQRMMADRMKLVALNNPSIILPDGDRLRADDLRRIACPVGVAHGAASPAVMATISRAMQEVMPQAQITEVAGAGHMLPITHVDAATDIMAEIWGRSAAS